MERGGRVGVPVDVGRGASRVRKASPTRSARSDDDRLVAAAAYVTLLERPEIAEALWDRHAARGDDPTELGRFAEVLREQVGPIDSDGLDWIMAR